MNLQVKVKDKLAGHYQARRSNTVFDLLENWPKLLQHAHYGEKYGRTHDNFCKHPQMSTIDGHAFVIAYPQTSW
jgi:hypothetical protein